MKARALELVNTKTNEKVGFTPIVKQKGRRDIGFTKKGEIVVFPTKKEAIKYAEDFILNS